MDREDNIWRSWQFLVCGGFMFAKTANAWVDHYDAGEDDEKVIKIMLPMVAIAVLACIIGYYIKNKFFKDKEDEEEKEEKGINRAFPAPKTNKPWLNMPPPQPIQKAPVGGYEFALPGYQQATGAPEKRTTSQQSGKSNASSGYASHITGVQQVTEKRKYQPTGPKAVPGHVTRTNVPHQGGRSHHHHQHYHRNENNTRGGHQVRVDRNGAVPNPQANVPASRPSRGGQR